MSSVPFPILSAALLSLLCLGVPFGGSRAEAPAAFDDEEILSVRYPDWFKQSFLDLPEDADIAAEAGKQGLFLFFTTEALCAQPGAGAGGGRDPAIGALTGCADRVRDRRGADPQLPLARAAWPFILLTMA